MSITAIAKKRHAETQKIAVLTILTIFALIDFVNHGLPTSLESCKMFFDNRKLGDPTPT